ncbi:Sodium/calcium exchanger 1 [Liparis tanakae]|uniref:Sodium/calcium exchanger 1 n=1 Tax=Liparis tanakae TaxID=230148 RepID=A0A4Z2E0X5_9TELE|nr:Sodium/calcium exchanger 1 [Liparis tanakae]
MRRRPASCERVDKLIHVKIIDDEEYEKNKNFFLELAEPRMVDMSLQKGAVLNPFLPLLLLFSSSSSPPLALTPRQRLFSPLLVASISTPGDSLST